MGFTLSVFILLLLQAPQAIALKCQLVALITDGKHDDRQVKCQVGDRLLPIDSHLDEFDQFLASPRAEKPNFDLEFDKATIIDHKFHIPSDSIMFFDSVKSDNGTKRSGRRLGGRDPSGDQGVLVLYVEDGDGRTPSYVADGVANSVEDNISGTYGDPVYPGERYMTCSNNQVDFIPWVGTTTTGVSITTGVYHITISNIVQGASTQTIEDAVEVQAATDLGDLRSQFDYGKF